MNDRRTVPFLGLCLVCLILAGCCSSPDTIDVTDILTGQTEVATGAATVASGAETVAGQADDLAHDLAGTEYAAKAERHAADTRKLAEQAKALQASVEKANLAMVKYIRNAEQAIRGKAQAMIEKEKYKGQRNTLLVIASALALLIGAFVVLKVKRLLPF
jgi:hypothetical protein